MAKVRQRNVTTNVVAGFLSRNGWRYLEVQRRIQELAEAFTASDKGRHIVYQIYSRADRQRGKEPFKEVWQIKEEVNRERGKGNDFTIKDVCDIVALTIVCLYPSGIKSVRSFLSDSEEDGHIRIFQDVTMEEKERGYKAQHIVAGLTDPRFDGIKCEIQIKTILHDAWSVWTHDVTYKPQGALPQGIGEHMGSISRMLTEVDGLSERFRKSVDKEWKREREIKKTCAKQILLRPDIDESPKALRQAYKNIFDDLRDKEQRYEASDVGPTLERIREFQKEYGPTKYSARLITLLAAIRKDDELEYLALDHIEEWAQQARERGEVEAALTFMGWTFFAFNRLSQAVDAGERALTTAVRADDDERIMQCKINLAHYLAERGDDRDGLRGRAARKLIEQIDVNQITKSSHKDTIGFVKITFADHREEIEDGLKLVEEAYKENRKDPVAKSYYTLHSDRGKSRLASMDDDRD